MTNHHTKLKDPLAMSSLVIDQTRFVYGPTDQRTYRPTCAKQYNPTPSKGGINIKPLTNTAGELKTESCIIYFYFLG